MHSSTVEEDANLTDRCQLTHQWSQKASVLHAQDVQGYRGENGPEGVHMTPTSSCGVWEAHVVRSAILGNLAIHPALITGYFYHWHPWVSGCLG